METANSRKVTVNASGIEENIRTKLPGLAVNVQYRLQCVSYADASQDQEKSRLLFPPSARKVTGVSPKVGNSELA